MFPSGNKTSAISAKCRHIARAGILGACFLMTSCAPTVISGCPPVPSWSDEDRNRLAGEVEALPNGTMIERAVNEYGTMREASRLCGGG